MLYLAWGKLMGESRKVQQTPTGTFFVCLPRDWAKQNGLKKGDLVSLDVTSDGKLVVDPSNNAEAPPRNYLFNCWSIFGSRDYWSLPSWL